MLYCVTVITKFTTNFQSRRGLNWDADRVEILVEAAYKERRIIRSNGGGTGIGRELKKQAWQRILGEESNVIIYILIYLVLLCEQRVKKLNAMCFRRCECFLHGSEDIRSD